MKQRQQRKWQVRGRWLPALASLLAAAAAAGPAPQDREAGQAGPINSARPLLDLAELMEQRYALPVTYEDPIWEFEGDLELLRTGRRGQFPMSRTFTAPPDLTPDQTPKLDVAALGKALTAYHLQTDGPRYKILASRLGLHLIPDQVRGPDGRLAPARNALDRLLSMPVTLRTPSEHMADLCAELSTATGARIQFLGPSGNYTLEQIYLPNGHNGRSGPRADLTVAWGAEGIPAREALINLLDASATSVPWRFVCKAGGECFIQVDAIRLAVAMPNGQVGWTALMYDRCATCPKLGAPPPPLIKK